jgi:WD40 repeat protein
VGGFEDNSVRVWNDLDSKPIMLMGHEDSVKSVNFLENNQIVSGACDNTIIIWSLNIYSPSTKLVGHSDCITGLVVLSNFSYMVSGSRDKTLIVWKNNGSNSFSWYKSNNMTGSVLTMAYKNFKNQNIIATGLNDSTINIWNFDQDFSTSKTLYGHSYEVLSLTFAFSSSLNQTVLASGSRDTNSMIKIW